MPRNDLLDQSATRVELDQRSRDARLRLEHVERLLLLRQLPRQSLLRRALRCLGLRIFVGEQIAGRSASPRMTGGRPRRGSEMPGETGGATGSLSAAPPPFWPSCRSELAVSRDGGVQHDLKAWDYACTRADPDARGARERL